MKQTTKKSADSGGTALAESPPLPAEEQLSPSDAAAREAGAVVVEIYDQVYQLSGTDPDHIEHLAALVDDKMRAVSASGSTVDSLRVAVLAALNIADELEELRERYHRSIHATELSIQSRAGSLMHMLDTVLEERRAG
jgi:cell division protein ZapA